MVDWKYLAWIAKTSRSIRGLPYAAWRRWNSRDILTATVNGVNLKLSPRRLGLTDELAAYGAHEPEMSRLYASQLCPGDTIFDLGTNVGYYAAIAAPHIPGGAIHMFEPDPELVELARKNLGRISKEYPSINIACFEEAVTDRIGATKFKRSVHGSNWGRVDKYGNIEVKTTTIDKIAEHVGPPDVIRMDIEGGEVEALAGARDTLRTYRPMLFLEIHLGTLGKVPTRALLNRLGRFGYKSAWVLPRWIDLPEVPQHRRRASLKTIMIPDFKVPNVTFLFLTRRGG